MKRDEAVTLLEHFGRAVKRSGTTTANYHGYNGWSVFLVKDSRYSYDSVVDWDVPGLFIANDEVRAAADLKKPYLTIFYKMGCGKVLALVLPIVFKNFEVKVPNNLTVLKKNGLFQGQTGFWIAIEHWHEIGNTNDYVVKKGAKKARHLARKPERAVKDTAK